MFIQCKMVIAVALETCIVTPKYFLNFSLHMIQLIHGKQFAKLYIEKRKK
jgi:hypothetical protein